MSPAPRTLLDVVDGIRGFLTRRAGSLVGAGSAAVVGVVLVAAFWLAGPAGWRSGTAVPLVLVLGGVGGLVAFAAWVGGRHRRWSAEARIAEEIERRARLPDGSVRGQVELSRAVPGGVSGSLAAAGEASILSRLPGSVQELAGRPGEALGRWLRVGVGVGVAAVVSVGALLALNPARAGAAWGGLIRPVALLTPEPLPALDVSPGDAALPRGEAVAVVIGAVGRDSVLVHWQSVGELPAELVVGVQSGRAETTLPPLEVSLRYWVSDRYGNESSTYTLTPADPSLLADLRIEVTYPPYTRLPSESFQVAPPWLQLPEGSTVDVSGRLQGTGTAIELIGETGDVALRLPVEAGSFSGGWSPVRSGVVTWEMERGVEGAQLPDPMEIEIIVDQAPALSLPVPGEDIAMPLARRVPLVAEAIDDYGVAWIEVDTRLVRAGQEGEPVLDRIPTSGLPQVALRPVLDFGTWGLEPGDEVLLRVRAADNAPVAHMIESAVYRISVPDEDALRETARQSIDQARAQSEELLDQIEREAAEQRDLQRRTEFSSGDSRGGSLDPEAFEDREELLRMLDQQAEVADALEALRAELTETREALEEMARRNEADAALSAQLEEIEEMLEQVMTPEERARLDEMREALRDGQMPETPEDVIQQMTDLQADLQERLDRALEELERAQLDEALREVEDEIESLIEEQREVTGELNEAEGQERQEQLAERTDDARSDLESLEEQVSQTGDSGPREQSEAAERELSDASDSMREAADAAEQGESDEAQTAAEEAAESLSEALEQMQAAREELQQTEEEQRNEALRESVQDALSLARRQSELRIAFGQGPLVRLEYVEEELALREGITSLQQNLRDIVGGGDPAVSGPIGAETQRAVDAAEQVAQGLRGGLGPQPDPQTSADSAQSALNRVAILALQAMGPEGEQPQQTAPGDESAQTMSDLSEQQQDINAESQQRARAGDQGTPTPMELEEMVAGQRGIASVLQEMAEQRGPGFAGSQLDQLSEESAELAEQLAEGRLDAPLIEQQERFLQRLLDAGRTLEQDGPTNEREGTTAEDTPRRAVTALPDALIDPAAFALPTSVQLDALTPGLRALVLDYFERVNRRRAAEEAIR